MQYPRAWLANAVKIPIASESAGKGADPCRRCTEYCDRVVQTYLSSLTFSDAFAALFFNHTYVTRCLREEIRSLQVVIDILHHLVLRSICGDGG